MPSRISEATFWLCFRIVLCSSSLCRGIQYMAGALPHISPLPLGDCASTEVQEQESHRRVTGVMSSRGGVQYREDVHLHPPSTHPCPETPYVVSNTLVFLLIHHFLASFINRSLPHYIIFSSSLTTRLWELLQGIFDTT